MYMYMYMYVRCKLHVVYRNSEEGNWCASYPLNKYLIYIYMYTYIHKRTHSYLLTREQKQLLDDRIESVLLRVDEFKKQLETMHENTASNSEKMQDLHDKMRMLKDLFKRIDQVEVS